jgi:hypothetical protein
MSVSDSWDDRLGWAHDLVADDSTTRQRAHARLTETQRHRAEALHRYNEVWSNTEHPEYRVRLDEWANAQSRTLPDALWHIGPGAAAEWHGLPYALLYLQWECRFPEEWQAHAKHWGTKKVLLNVLTRHGDGLPAETTGPLVDLIIEAVSRPYRCEDVGYARLARTLDGAALRGRLEMEAGKRPEIDRRRVRYLLWLLEHPGAPRPKRTQWLLWLSTFGQVDGEA